MQTPNDSDNRAIEALLDEFLAAHPGVQAAEFRAWAAGQVALKDHMQLVEQVALGIQGQGLSELQALLGSVRERVRQGLHARLARQGSALAPEVLLAPGTRVAHFLLRRCLGRGGMGEVWEAQDEELQRRVALKFIIPGKINPRTTELFEREARAGARLTHPNLVRTLAFGRANNLTWLAQELVEGSRTVKDDLEQLRSQINVPTSHYRRAAELVAQIADGLQAAHTAGVIHRDIKPQNILIAPDQTPKLADFGLARVSEDLFLSVTGEFAGTHFYMSPEQVTAKRIGLDHRTDIFSLGAVLYELLSLRRPFEGDTTQQISQKILFFDPPDPTKVRSQCPRDLSVICGKALAKDPNRRYQSMAELALDLRRYLSNRPILARPPGKLYQLRLWARRHPTPSVAIALGGVAMAVISSLLAQQVQHARLLSDVNSQLAGQTARAESGEQQAKQTTLEVLALSSQKELDDLVAEAALLWPAHPDLLPRYEQWLQSARALIHGVPADPVHDIPGRPSLADHKEKLAELRGDALAFSPEQVRLERETQAQYGELQAKQAELLWRSRMLGLEPWPETAAVESELTAETLPDDAATLNSMAWSVVDPQWPLFGREVWALNLAQRALDAAPQDLRAGCRDTLAWAHFRVGRLDAALAEAQAALAETGGQAFDPSVKNLGMAVHEWREEQREQRLKEHAALGKEVLALAEALENPWAYRFNKPEQEWWYRQLSELVFDLEALQNPHTGLMNDVVSEPFGWGVAKRHEFAKSIADRSVSGPSAAQLWDQAGKAIQASPRYAGLRLEPQLGLLPLGPDPQSQLWEFAHLQSGEPARRESNGQLAIAESTGIVLVLIPGGRFLMGAQSAAPDRLGFDPQASSPESPAHEVELSAYFLSKFELTQAQWLRLNDVNPSSYQPAEYPGISLLHPVEQVSWREGSELLAKLGLCLPSEAQWEYAARAGTSTPWWTGAARESLLGRANLADQAAKRAGAQWRAIDDWPTLDDGNSWHGPIGSFPANAFGLHEMAGNLFEWCRDAYRADFYFRPTGRDPSARGSATAHRVIRGGSFAETATLARSSSRSSGSPELSDSSLGLRPARSVDLTPSVLQPAK